MSSSNKSPVFPMPEHFSDYGFDPQFDYFQVLEEARNRQSEDLARSINSFRFKLRKPASEYFASGTPYNNNADKRNTKKKSWWWWWNKASKFFGCTTKPPPPPHMIYNEQEEEDRDVHLARAREFRAAAAASPISGPLYMAETPPHKQSQPLNAGLMSPASGCSSPYLSLRELNMERQHLHRMSASASPVYMVT